MKNYLFMLLAFVVLTGGVSYQAYAEDKKTTVGRIEILDRDTMEKMRKLGKPAELQYILGALIGNWDYDLSFYSKAGAEPQLSTGRIENELIMNDRFLSSKTTIILNIGGQNIPYKGQGMLGYDNAKKAFTSVWVDSTRTGMINGEGTYDEKTKTLEIKGRLNHPLFDKERPYRTEIKLTDIDKYTQAVFIADKSGKEYKLLELEFRRPNY